MRNSFIGQRINFLRKQAGMTMQELGLKVGFGEATADIRISQYEHGTRLPRLEVLVKMAAALHCEPEALLYPDCDSIAGIMHLFFYLEERYGFKPYISPDGEIGFKLQPKTDKVYDSALYGAISCWWIANAGIIQGFLTEKDYQFWKNNFRSTNLFDLMPCLQAKVEEEGLQYPNPAPVDSRMCALGWFTSKHEL